MNQTRTQSRDKIFRVGAELPWWKLCALLVCALVAMFTFLIFKDRRPQNRVPFHDYDLRDLREWTAIGGSWQTQNGVLYNDSYERGAKLLSGSPSWENYTVTTDLSYTGSNADMGLIVRSSDERKGTDTYHGYYVGFRTLDGTFVIGRSDFDWREARPVLIPGGVAPNIWYRMKVTAYGCNIGASLENLQTLQTAWLAVEDPDCVKAGRIGVRSLNSGMWTNIRVAAATIADYDEMRRHAVQVEKPEVLPSPPWWTPWHTAILFGGTLLFALSAQLFYFRIRQWKMLTITRERERLAHDIHDTMAQGFAGIGYQIQGIQHSLLQDKQVDSLEIAAQLGVAYQLVRRCHQEASRTIAMLGSSSLASQENLLETLRATATKLAGEQIQTKIEVRGEPVPLNLRLVDALSHIGSEAIVNAIQHSGLTRLEIRLAYRGNTVELSIADNGCGFDAGSSLGGYGVTGMQKRARDMGGILVIESTPDNGTRLGVTAKVVQETSLSRMATFLPDLLRDRQARSRP